MTSESFMTDRIAAVAKAKTTKVPATKTADSAAVKSSKVPTPKATKAAPVDAAPAVKPNALQKPLTPSAALAAVVGSAMLSRGDVVKKVWEYIRANNLQNPADKREILADAKLKKVFGRDKCTMFEMNKYLAQNLK